MDGQDASSTSAAAGAAGVVYTHDTRLQWPSLLFMTDQQVLAIQSAIQCPVLVILGDEGMPALPKMLQVCQDSLRPAKAVTLPGSHHLHADPETAGAVCETVLDFLKPDEKK